MTVFVRGVTRTISAGFNGRVYGPIVWSASPASSMVLAPAADGMTCKATPPLSAIAGVVLISVSSIDRLGKKIGGSVSVTLEAVQAPPPPPPPAPPGPPPVPAPEFTISARVQADGTVVLDSPIGQHSIQELPDGNFLAMFGSVFAPEAVVRHLGPHHIDLFDAAGKAVLHADLRAHYWNSRVPLRTKPVTIARTPADLVAEGFSFPYGNTGVPVQPCANYQYWGAFSAAYSGITVYMPTTGERPSIGLLTDPEGEFMRTGRAGPMLAWADCGTDFPWFFYDEAAANFLDLTVYPEADSYDNPRGKAPYVIKGPKDPTNGYFMYGGGMTPQLAHLWSAAYIAGAATKDLIYLSTVQAEAEFAIVSSAEASGPGGVVIHGEWRGSAWGHGMLFKAIRLTQDFESRGPLPPRYRSSAYFLKLNASTLAYWSAQMTSDVGIASGVCMEAGAVTVGPWQQNYWLMVLAFGMLTGRQEWLAFYLRMLKFAVMIYGGADGFPPGYGTPYYIDIRDDNGVAIADGKTLFADFLKNELRNALTAAAHGQQYDPQVTQAQYDALQKDPLNGGKAMVGAGYNISGRAALVMGDHLDRNGPAWIRGKVRAAHPSFDLALKNIQAMVLAAGYMEPKVSVIAP